MSCRNCKDGRVLPNQDSPTTDYDTPVIPEFSDDTHHASCGCNKCKKNNLPRAYVHECEECACDSCRRQRPSVRICSFVVPNLEQGRAFANSFVYNQEDDSVYYIDDSGTEIAFGSRPMFIDDFNPDERSIPRQVVYDFKNSKVYVYDAVGNYKYWSIGADGYVTQESLDSSVNAAVADIVMRVTENESQISEIGESTNVRLTSLENDKADRADLARVALTGQYADLIGIPQSVSGQTAEGVEFTTTEKRCDFGVWHFYWGRTTTSAGEKKTISHAYPAEFEGNIRQIIVTPGNQHSAQNQVYSTWTSNGSAMAMVDSLGGNNNFDFLILAIF